MVIDDWLSTFLRADAPRGVEARDRARLLLRDLGDPQDRVRAVHVVGTAGKGTTARLVADTLRRRGDTVGLHLSPHVHDVRERFTVADGVASASQSVGHQTGRRALPGGADHVYRPNPVLRVTEISEQAAGPIAGLHTPRCVGA